MPNISHKKNQDDRIIGHLPREISRPTKFLIDLASTGTVTIWLEKLSEVTTFSKRIGHPV